MARVASRVRAGSAIARSSRHLAQRLAKLCLQAGIIAFDAAHAADQDVIGTGNAAGRAADEIVRLFDGKDPVDLDNGAERQG